MGHTWETHRTWTSPCSPACVLFSLIKTPESHKQAACFVRHEAALWQPQVQEKIPSSQLHTHFLLPHEHHGFTEKALDQQKEMDMAAQATALDRQRQGWMMKVRIHTNLNWPRNCLVTLKHSTSKSGMVLKMTNTHLQANVPSTTATFILKWEVDKSKYKRSPA